MDSKQLKPTKFTETFGWIGVVAILGAYALLTFNVLPGSDWRFHALNAVGAVGIVVDATAQRNWQPAVLNIVWFVIRTKNRRLMCIRFISHPTVSC